MHKKIVFSLLFVLFVLPFVCKSQLKNNTNVWAFAKPIIQGVVLKETYNDVEKQDTAFFLYLETTSSSPPQISFLAYSGKVFLPAVYSETQVEFIVGIRQADDTKIRLKKKQGSFLWKVELTPSQNRYSGKARAGKITVKGKAGTQNFSFLLQPVRLHGDDTP